MLPYGIRYVSVHRYGAAATAAVIDVAATNKLSLCAVRMRCFFFGLLLFV